jgi:hypothetical protein
MNRTKILTWLFFCWVIFPGCHSVPEKPTIQYEVLNTTPIIDSLSARFKDYKENFNLWKTVYEQCVNDTLFQNAFYLGLQQNLHIAGISNQEVLNLNKDITILDTSSKGDIFNIIAIYKSANCFSKINLNKYQQDIFYNELTGDLDSSGDFTFLSGMIDTSQINFNIGTLTDFSIRIDSLVSTLQRTKDSSLLYFRQLLITPGNALFARAVMILGFDAEFYLKRKLNPEETARFQHEVFFKMGNYGDKGSIQILPDQRMKVVISKNFTVFGQFYVFK